MPNTLFTRAQIGTIEGDTIFHPLHKLFTIFGQVYDDGSVSVNLHRPVMPHPSKTRWADLPFNEGDCLIDLVWDLFRENGYSYKQGEPVFDKLRANLGVISLTPKEVDFLRELLTTCPNTPAEILVSPEISSILKKLVP